MEQLLAIRLCLLRLSSSHNRLNDWLRHTQLNGTIETKKLKTATPFSNWNIDIQQSSRKSLQITMYLFIGLLYTLQRDQRKAPINNLFCSKALNTQKIEPFTHLRKIRQFLVAINRSQFTFVLCNNFTYLGSLAKVSLHVQSIIP